ncbi:MAG: EthD domain-containing protein [Janthinobacterium lividum]
MTRPDYSERDRSIKLLTYTILRRREGVPNELFHPYWSDAHGPLCARLPGLGYYVQYHLAREQSANLWPLPAGAQADATELDGMVEIGFADAAQQQRFQQASPVLFQDERNFIGQDAAYNLPQGSHTLVDHDPTDNPNAPETAYRLLLHLHGPELAPLRRAATRLAESLATQAGILKVRLHLPEPYDNSKPTPEAPDVRHQLPSRELHLAALEIRWENRLLAERYLRGADYQALAAELAGVVTSLGTFLVAEVITFIRDGVLTTAGQRGGRPARLIEQLGALNQTSDEVLNYFLPPS